MDHIKSAPPTFSGPKQRIPVPVDPAQEELSGEAREMIRHIASNWPFEQIAAFIAELSKELFSDLHASIESAAQQEKLSKSRVEQLNNTLHGCLTTGARVVDRYDPDYD